MNNKIISLSTIVLICGISNNANAALVGDATLLMGPQTGFCDYDLGTYPDSCVVATIPDGNYFAMDNDGSGFLENSERVGIEAGTDGGIKLSSVQGAGEIDSVWSFFDGDGYHITLSGITVSSDNGAGNVTLDMTGWTLFWGGETINMVAVTDAIVSCGNTCENGDSFTLDYNALVLTNNLADIPYQLHLTGTVSSVPVPSAVWLFGSGFFGLIGMARRKKV